MLDRWLPIATAPTDGTTVDLWDGTSRRTDCTCDNERWRQFIGYRDRVPWYITGFTPTHWRPRPQSPTEEEQQGQLTVEVTRMRTSGGTDYFVQIECARRTTTPFVFSERWKAQYEADHLAWIFGLRPDEPELLSYSAENQPND